MRDAFLPQQPPDQGVVDLPETVVGSPDGGNGPGEGPAHGVEHGQRPEVVGAARVVVVEPGLDDVSQRGQVGAAVRVFDALGARRRAGCVGEREEGGFVGSGVREPGPAVGAVRGVVLDAFEDGFVEGAGELAFAGVGVGVDDEGDGWVRLAV